MVHKILSRKFCLCSVLTMLTQLCLQLSNDTVFFLNILHTSNIDITALQPFILNFMSRLNLFVTKKFIVIVIYPRVNYFVTDKAVYRVKVKKVRFSKLLFFLNPLRNGTGFRNKCLVLASCGTTDIFRGQPSLSF